MRGLDALLALLFPPKCPFCGALLAEAEAILCAECQRELPWLTGAQAERQGEFLALAVSPLRYRDKVRRAVHRYKFSGKRQYARPFGLLTAQCIRDHLSGRYDLISWVPLSARSLRRRGYDQARLLAEEAARALAVPILPTLRKIRDTRQQSRLEDPAARRANVLGAYEAVAPEQIGGRSILLIDDVFTSGATASECARILLTAGAKTVFVATLAQAGTKH